MHLGWISVVTFRISSTGSNKFKEDAVVAQNSWMNRVAHDEVHIPAVTSTKCAGCSMVIIFLYWSNNVTCVCNIINSKRIPYHKCAVGYSLLLPSDKQVPLHIFQYCQLYVVIILLCMCIVLCWLHASGWCCLSGILHCLCTKVNMPTYVPPYPKH